ncbi:biotin--[acetyl-CoA-carboxylase] ligase [Stappia indica]|uniref:biotin--[acetyl-CoA-carboxylase] ligase n=1 Tax=Stappia indica TaxID=538381 RepID=UPI001D19466A|nr:biotin--[acetyl-CoA-carboxylase] ligase [Stappia indica]MCC4245549.1 biotin--[acetyl-CoA-carboxylase] ligase [Stappia indica]
MSTLAFDGRVREVPGVAGYRVAAHAELGSTNSAALAAAGEGDPGNLWIVAGRQTSGRGRRARPWVSEPGNLYASLLTIDPVPPVRIGQFPLVAALALADAVDTMTGTYGLVRLKWPNDLLVDGAKISGILLEATLLADGRRAVVCGFGLNLSHHPDLPDYRAANLAGLGFQVTPDRAFAALAASIAQQMTRWREAPFSQVLDDWRRRAVGIGAPIRVRLEDRELNGIFAGLDPEGRLVLETGDTRQTIAAGDVFFDGAALGASAPGKTAG